jgi:ribonuclease HI
LQHSQDLNWAKLIWNPAIPPSKALLAWRLMYDKIPTDENLLIRGCHMPSMCSICKNHEESTFHVFFECGFAVKTWSWLAGCLNRVIQFNAMEDIWKLCDLNWSPQCKVTITAVIINLINTIWYVRNQARFHNKLLPWYSAIAMIISNTSLAGNSTAKPSSSSLRDFTFLKLFSISIHQPKETFLKEVCWQPPLIGWLKCNIDGVAAGCPGNASCGGVFRNHSADFILSFAEPLGLSTSYFAELCGAMRAIEIAFQNNWHDIWIETDSCLVVSAFQCPNRAAPWVLRNRWRNVVHMVKGMNCLVTHIYREGNQVADLMANHGLSLVSIVYWQVAPLFIRDSFEKNKLGYPCFRICS